MEHTAHISKSTSAFHINLDDSDNHIHMWQIITSSERVDIITIWVSESVIVEYVGSLSVNFGGGTLPFTY